MKNTINVEDRINKVYAEAKEQFAYYTKRLKYAEKKQDTERVKQLKRWISNIKSKIVMIEGILDINGDSDTKYGDLAMMRAYQSINE